MTDFTKTITISSAAAFVEVMGGQPLDRWKVNIQLPPHERMSFRNLLYSGHRKLYAGLSTCLGYSCVFYFPAIYGLEHIYNRFGIHNDLSKSIFVTTFISFGVSWIESVKTDQQVNNYRDKHIIEVTKDRFKQYGIQGIMPSYTMTFARELCYCSGLLVLSPLIAKRIEVGNKHISSFIGGCLAAIASQSVSQPFDTIKTRQEKYKVSISTIMRKIILEERISTLWRGLMPRCIRGMWSISCMSVMMNFIT